MPKPLTAQPYDPLSFNSGNRVSILTSGLPSPFTGNGVIEGIQLTHPHAIDDPWGVFFGRGQDRVGYSLLTGENLKGEAKQG